MVPPGDARATTGPGPALPAVSLPKGGGAVRGLGESFTVNAVTGTASLSVPVTTSPGRSGTGPRLALGYDSGSGNGAFGLGWSLTLPEVARRTDRGVPRYGPDDDTFLISGAEDLVPQRDPGQGWARVSRIEDGHRVERYRPRTEGLFAQIERWTRLSDGDCHWRSVSADNVTTWFGEDAEARVADPADPSRVLRWLVSRSCDDKGNAVRYRYAAEDGTGADLTAAHERHRTAAVRSANRYLKRILYGDQAPGEGWLFEVVFDYGDHDPDAPAPAPDRPWPVRADPFSSYRGGFEVRTYRLCRRVLMFHHFPDEPDIGADCLVRATKFTYSPGEAAGTYLTAVAEHGYRATAAGPVSRTMPSVEFEYTRPTLHDEVRELEVAGDGTRWVDVDGDGLPGALTEEAAGWWVRRNLGDGRFGAPRPVTPPRRPRAAAGVRRRHGIRAPGGHNRRRTDRPGPGPQRRGLLLAEPGVRAVRREGGHGRRAVVRPRRTVRSSAAPAGGRRRLRPHRPAVSRW